MAESDITDVETCESAAVEVPEHPEEVTEHPAEREALVFTPKPVYEFFKAIFDFVSSLIASIILLIPLSVIALIIISKDKGHPFYFHKRVGKNASEIRVCKFRSMKMGADDLEKMLTPEQLAEYKKEYKLNDDPRLIGYKNPGDSATCFGSKIRKMSIDELPQILLNILIFHNMSVVGPRPILRSELEENYTPEEQKLLLSIKPGLTGYWQAYARNKAGYKNGARQKIELFYVHNRSFIFDMKIIFKTVAAVLFEKGAN